MVNTPPDWNSPGKSKTPPPPSMGKMFGRGTPEMAPPDTSGKKSKSEAFYINPPGRCRDCSHFNSGGGGGDCELVDASSEGFDSGTISPDGYCCLFESGEGSMEKPGAPKEKETGEKAELFEPKSSVPDWQEYPQEVAA